MQCSGGLLIVFVSFLLATPSVISIYFVIGFIYISSGVAKHDSI